MAETDPMFKKAYFEILDTQTHLAITLGGHCELEPAAKFEAEIGKHAQEVTKHVIVNLEHLEQITGPWLRPLMMLNRKLKAARLKMILIRVAESVRNTLLEEGVDQAFEIKANLREALNELGLAKKKLLDVDFLNPFLVAALDALKTQADVSAKPGKPFVKDDPKKMTGDISGVIGIVSDTFSGLVVVSFPQLTFMKVMSRMFGEEVKEINPEVVSGASELANIIFGRARTVLNKQGYGIKSALPSVVLGKSHQVENVGTGPSVVVPFETDIGPFYIEICLSS